MSCSYSQIKNVSNIIQTFLMMPHNYCPFLKSLYFTLIFVLKNGSIAFFWKIRGPKYIIKKWAYYLHTIQQKFLGPETFLVNIVHHRAVSSDPLRLLKTPSFHKTWRQNDTYCQTLTAEIKQNLMSNPGFLW